MTENERSSESIQTQFSRSLRKLEADIEQAYQKDGYSDEIKKMRFLLELMREQIQDENSLPSTRAAR